MTKRQGVQATYSTVNLLTNLLAVDLCLGLELLGTARQLILC